MDTFRLGIDLGSTTAKVVLIDASERPRFSDYQRHNTQVRDTLRHLLSGIREALGDIPLQIAFSGSTGMDLAESTRTPFIQEVIAAASLVRKRHPEVKSLIDIGGEDAKLILFNDFKNPDIRMNGACAGGTGAYIDQMAALLNVSIPELDALARQSTQIYPIASRCGVFAKTDVQNLVSRKIAPADIAASIFEAVAEQTINSLARGCTIEPRLLFTGGPLTYIPYLGEAFAKLLKIRKEDIIIPDRAELFTALGTAIAAPADAPVRTVSEFLSLLAAAMETGHKESTLPPLFENREDHTRWEKERRLIAIPGGKAAGTCWLGIDSGSTTTKIVAIDAEGAIRFSFYKNNGGKPLETVLEGLAALAEAPGVHIQGAAVTGYGEELIKTALKIETGVVETVAHFMAARKIAPDVSFILDIGGQDIKAIFVQNGVISNIELNESCSSGCGSFIENFAHSLGHTPTGFSHLATQSAAPYDLGSRCTVFMNSKVKQAISDGATVSDLSAGLAYSVIKNCLNKVLRIKNMADMGDTLVVQGGTFKNVAVFRSLELLSGKKVVVSDKPELMGAFGAALHAMQESAEGKECSFIGLGGLNQAAQHTTQITLCGGCTNNCRITTYRFAHGGRCYSGNKCEKIFTSSLAATNRGENIFEYKRELLFDRKESAAPKGLRIGIPRILNMYEDYPFWYALLSQCGFEVVLSDESTLPLHKKGIGALMSDNICFPAKLAHGHVVDLLEKKVDRIFLPFTVYAKKEFATSAGSFNCPIVTAYGEVLKSTTLLSEAAEVPFDAPPVNFNDARLLEKTCRQYLSGLGIGRDLFRKAFDAALAAQKIFREAIKEKNREILKNAQERNEPVILVAGHPYHLDRLVHQQVSHILTDLGVHVINEDITVGEDKEGFDAYYTIAQWEYPNRILQAVWWASQQTFPLGTIQLNSFGCGPDSFIMDEIRNLASRKGLPFALLRIDEISSPGSIKLRLRSLVESMKLKQYKPPGRDTVLPAPSIFDEAARNRTILVPWFSEFYSPLFPVLGKLAGLKMKNLPPSDKISANLGLEHANNEVCYPATLVIGDVLRALSSGKYKPEEVAIGIPQTGWQCRASNYTALLRRALVHAGFGNVPIVSFSLSKEVAEKQPGFRINLRKLIKPAFLGLLFVDSLSRIYYATASRESIPGAARRLKDKYMVMAADLLESRCHNHLPALLSDAVRDFNALPVMDGEIKAVGVVGEIYVKYNAFGQAGVVDWLVENGVEVILPPLAEFFSQAFVNSGVRARDFIDPQSPFWFLGTLLEALAGHYTSRFEKILQGFRFYRRGHDIRHAASLASEICSLENQYGEGWLIPAGIASFAQQGIQQVICLQPFGCIANHVIGKGMEKKIKELYPEMNLLYLDFDAGVGRVNVINRLQFLIQNMAA